VHTQGSLKAEKGKGSGQSQGSHGGSAININNKKNEGTKSNGNATNATAIDSLGPPHAT